MADSGSSNWFPALFTAIGNHIGEHFYAIGAVSSVLAFLLAVLSLVFDVQLSSYGTAFIEFVSGGTFLAFLLLVILVSQVLIFQRIEWIVDRLEVTEDEEVDDDSENLKTDGGERDVPPRDSKGRFTTKDRGGSNLLLILLAAAGGYLAGSEYGAIDPLIGALVGVAIISFIQAFEG